MSYNTFFLIVIQNVLILFKMHFVGKKKTIYKQFSEKRKITIFCQDHTLF